MACFQLSHRHEKSENFYINEINPNITNIEGIDSCNISKPK
jgi:hypothetical protein